MINRYSRTEMSNIWSDQAMYQAWLDVELAVCRVQAAHGLIPAASLEAILSKASFNINRIEELETIFHHDMIAFLTCVHESVNSDDSRFIHFGLTSSDVKDTGLNLQLKQAGQLIDKEISALLDVLSSLAQEHKNLLCIGRSHGVHAEPISFGFKLLNFYNDLKRSHLALMYSFRDLELCMISGAMGTYALVAPYVELEASELLGLQAAKLSTQVIARDMHARLLNEMATFGSVLERLAIEIRHLQRTEVLEVEEPFYEKQKGSSAMPHKRNPWRSENLSGLARMLRSYAGVGLENIALWHERDISHSSAERIVLPDATMLIDFMVHRMTQILKGLRVYPENMQANLYKFGGVVFSQQVLAYLLHKGLSRDAAYEIVQSCATAAWMKGNFRQLISESEEVQKYLSSEEIDKCFSTAPYLAHMDYIFGRIL